MYVCTPHITQLTRQWPVLQASADSYHPLHKHTQQVKILIKSEHTQPIHYIAPPQVILDSSQSCNTVHTNVPCYLVFKDPCAAGVMHSKRVEQGS